MLAVSVVALVGIGSVAFVELFSVLKCCRSLWSTCDWIWWWVRACDWICRYARATTSEGEFEELWSALSGRGVDESEHIRLLHRSAMSKTRVRDRALVEEE